VDQINADLNGNWYRLSRKNSITKFYVDQSVKLVLDQEKTKSIKIEEDLETDTVCRQFC